MKKSKKKKNQRDRERERSLQFQERMVRFVCLRGIERDIIILPLQEKK